VWALLVNFKGALTPSVQAAVSGEFVGTVLHINGAAEAEDKTLTPLPVWKAGEMVTLSLNGRLNEKTGKTNIIVDKIEPTKSEAADAAPEVE